MIRSLLFVPGILPRLFPKALASSADQVAFDLEDSVFPARGFKRQARRHVVGYLKSLSAGERERTAIRINNVRSGEAQADVGAVQESGCPLVLYPKFSTEQDVEFLTRTFPATRRRGRNMVRLIPLVESVKGLRHVRACADRLSNIVALAFGCEDFGADLALPASTPYDQALVAQARVELSLLARARGWQFLDGPCLDIRGRGVARRLRAECAAGRAAGATGKLAIHPAQVGAINRIFSPRPAEVRRSLETCRAVVAGGSRSGRCAMLVRGRLVAWPELRRLGALLAVAREAERGEGRRLLGGFTLIEG